MAPSPELSTKRSRLRSSTSFCIGLQHGRDVALEFPGVAGVQFVHRHCRDGHAVDLVDSYFHGVSLSSPFWGFVLASLRVNAVSSAFIAIVSHFIDAPGDDVGAESGLARAIERRRWRGRRVERIAEMMQPDRRDGPGTLRLRDESTDPSRP